MTTNEKILLVQLILEDIRGNWGGGFYGYDAEGRATKAKSLCEEIASETNNNEYITLAKSCINYINGSRRCGDWDGRYFREPFPRGYENMDELHGLTHTFKDKSEDFQFTAEEYLTYPDVRFDDWEERFATSI